MAWKKAHNTCVKCVKKQLSTGPIKFAKRHSLDLRMLKK